MTRLLVVPGVCAGAADMQLSQLDVVAGIGVRFDPADAERDMIPEEVECLVGVSVRKAKPVSRVRVDPSTSELQPLLGAGITYPDMQGWLRTKVAVVKLRFLGLAAESEGHTRVREVAVAVQQVPRAEHRLRAERLAAEGGGEEDAAAAGDWRTRPLPRPSPSHRAALRPWAEPDVRTAPRTPLCVRSGARAIGRLNAMRTWLCGSAAVAVACTWYAGAPHQGKHDPPPPRPPRRSPAGPAIITAVPTVQRSEIANPHGAHAPDPNPAATLVRGCGRTGTGCGPPPRLARLSAPPPRGQRAGARGGHHLLLATLTTTARHDRRANGPKYRSTPEAVARSERPGSAHSPVPLAQQRSWDSFLASPWRRMGDMSGPWRASVHGGGSSQWTQQSSRSAGRRRAIKHQPSLRELRSAEQRSVAGSGRKVTARCAAREGAQAAAGYRSIYGPLSPLRGRPLSMPLLPD
jgi:hypothetical protein